MLEPYLLTHPWLPAALWALLYTSDYYLTLWGARLSRSQDFFRREGSYELTPQFQEDVDKQRHISRTFLKWLVIGTIVLLIAPHIYGVGLYAGIVGWFIFPEIVVHIRHLSNISWYRRLNSPNPGVSGQIVISTEHTYRQSALELVCWAAFLFLVFALTRDPIFLGGGLYLIQSSYRDLSLMRWYSKKAAAEQHTPETAQSDVPTAEGEEVDG